MVKINDFGLKFAKSGAIASPFVAEYRHPASDWRAFVITNEHLVTNFAEGGPDELRGYLVAHRVCLVGVHQSPDVLRNGPAGDDLAKVCSALPVQATFLSAGGSGLTSSLQAANLS
jgi:hypothetical protein